jgi:hypothetical protein
VIINMRSWLLLVPLLASVINFAAADEHDHIVSGFSREL